jgi:hypothetical protein
MPHPSRWSNITAPAITAVILGAAMFAPTSAHAECGSYVVYTNPAQQPPDSQPMGEHKAPVGCHGPNCSKMPPANPVPQTPPTLRILADETLILSAGDSVAPPSPQTTPIDSTDGEVVRRPSDVYHPPR